MSRKPTGGLRPDLAQYVGTVTVLLAVTDLKTKGDRG